MSRRRHRRSPHGVILTSANPNTNQNLSPEPLLRGMPVKWVEYLPAPREQRKKARSKYKKLRAGFKDYAIDLCRNMSGRTIPREELLNITRGYNIHHKLPVSLGGTSDRNNMVLIEPNVHNAIHRKVDHIILSFENLRNLYTTTSEQSRKGEILKQMRNIGGLRVTVQDGGLQAFITLPYPTGPFYIPGLVGGIARPPRLPISSP